MTRMWIRISQVGIVVLSLLVFGVVAQSAKSREGETLWLVTSRDAGLMKDLQKVSTPHYEKGRIRLVTLKQDFGKLPKKIQAIIRLVKKEEVKSYEPVAKLKKEADPKIVKVLENVDRASYTKWMTQMVGYDHRSVGGLSAQSGSGNQLAVAWLQDQFASYGYSTWKHCYSEHSYAQECNVIAEKKGTTHPEEVIVIEGHLDDVGKNRAGADDNASGSIALLEMARVLAGYNSQRTIRFMATNGEESGLVGSKAYVTMLKKSGSLSQIQFVINMDMIAYNKNGKVDIETSYSYEEEANWYADQVRAYTTLTPNISMPAWGSDHVPFINEGVPAVLTIEYWDTHTPCYHATCDKMDTLNMDYALEIIRLNLAVAIQKAKVDL